jgi:hypothetical protein
LASSEGGQVCRHERESRAGGRELVDGLDQVVQPDVGLRKEPRVEPFRANVGGCRHVGCDPTSSGKLLFPSSAVCGHLKGDLGRGLAL